VVPTNKEAKEGNPLWKDVIFPLLAHPALKWLQIGTDMLLIIISTGTEFLKGMLDD